MKRIWLIFTLFAVLAGNLSAGQTEAAQVRTPGYTPSGAASEAKAALDRVLSEKPGRQKHQCFYGKTVNPVTGLFCRQSMKIRGFGCICIKRRNACSQQ